MTTTTISMFDHRFLRSHLDVFRPSLIFLQRANLN